MDISATSATPEEATILIVDDTPTNLQIIVDYLEEYSFRIVVAGDGEEGIKRARFLKPNLILLDVLMPGMNGFDTCRMLKAAEDTRDIPVIFMTALTDINDKVAGFDAGGADYITKPFHMPEVLARINAHLALRSTREQLVASNLKLHHEINIRQEAEVALKKVHEELLSYMNNRAIELAQANVRLSWEIEQHKRAEARVGYMANYDVLTGLPNRTQAEAYLARLIGKNSEEKIGVLFIDLDNFKHVNDSLGHQVGDQILREISTRLQKCVDGAGGIARFGGDEYLVVLPQLESGNYAAFIAQRLNDVLCRPLAINGQELHAHGSIGISLYPNDGTDAQTLIRAAETAMYHAKEKGRSNFQFFTVPLNEAVQRRLSLVSRLHHALDRKELIVFYQPQWNMESGRIVSVEALLRWKQTDGGFISPGEFIGIAEETGLIVPIGEYVLREACEQLVRWRKSGYPDLTVAVNVSARQLFQPGFENYVEQVLRETGLPQHALELEITESLFMLPREDSILTLKKLVDMGVKLSMDDFGTGYSSLAYLQRLPLHILKIDRSFVASIGPKNYEGAIVVAIIAMAQSLKLKIVAEGVETPEQMAFLKARGCFIAQGYYCSPPLPPDMLVEMLEKKQPTS